ncbi:MAG: PBP1A family penicillin-binding protein [Desulfobacteraceae bacterium]|nr:PBP1A family penicillin-binding protein [Desulfobacteraceae bacterium]
MKKPAPQRREPEKKPLRWFVFTLFSVLLCLGLMAGIAVFAFFIQIDQSLPSGEALKTYHPPLVTSVYSADGELIGEFFIERRYLVPLRELPPHLIKAFIAAEDARFYEHSGVDLIGIFRAMVKNIQAGEIVQGGSTITQQVVKSLLLTPERTFTRKIKEALLAYRIDHSLSKNEILYLYLNQIYFGAGAYGVEAAARTYFDKHASELDLAEASLLAGLPKAPSRFSPVHHFPVARERQQYVLQRMVDSDFVSVEEARKALAVPLQIAKPKRWTLRELDYFTEEVRRQAEARFGRDMLYKEGLIIQTTLDVRAQRLAEKALDQGLRELDKRHQRYRGLHVNVPKDDWPTALRVLVNTNGNLTEGKVVAGMIKEFDARAKSCVLDLGPERAVIPQSGWQWTHLSEKRAEKVFRTGDILRIKLLKRQDEKVWTAALEQDPSMEGALMSINPLNGRVICMVGGRNFEKSQFNRCTQAVRQPGSSFKPIIYSAALDRGWTEASILIDSPVSYEDRSGRGPWRPANYDRQFWGPILLRKALIHSRNVVTVKLLESIGPNYTINYAKQLGINSPLTPTLSLALGASGVTMNELLTAYSAFADRGERVQPYLIERVLDRNHNLIEEHQVKKEAAIAPQTAYLITDLLQAVVQEGTGARAKELGRPTAGKTGTTNELKDAWFIGYTPSVLTGVWVGYDDHNVSLGKGETGGRAACPIWVYFMKEYLKEKPIETFAIPEGIIFAKINPHSGAVTRSDEPGAVYAAFSGSLPTPGTEPRAAGEEIIAEAPDDYFDSSNTYTPARLSPPPRSPSGESFFKSDLF